MLPDLFRWQQQALELLLGKDDGQFGLRACPGAGKTVFSFAAYLKLVERQIVRKLVVVVPSDGLCEQWAEEAHKVGINLDPSHVTGNPIGREFHGIVVTYQKLANQPESYRRLIHDAKAIVVADEVHHCGDDSALRWGPGIKVAFPASPFMLFLSGTPFRSDNNRIPLLNYSDVIGVDGKSEFVPDYSYDYGDALIDRVVRRIEFLAYDGNTSWTSATIARGCTDLPSDITTVDIETLLSEASKKNRARALDAAFDPDGKFMPAMLARGHKELLRQRLVTPNAGGLVIASSRARAKAYADMLETICGEKPEVVTHDDTDAKRKITAFKKSKRLWIIAVNMISEGVDIKRLGVEVYATTYGTLMFFIQATGRVIRKETYKDKVTGLPLVDDNGEPIEDKMVSMVLLPSVEPLLTYAANIENEINIAIEEKAAGQQPPQSEFISVVLSKTSEEAIETLGIVSGDLFDDVELTQADVERHKYGFFEVSKGRMAAFLRKFKHERDDTAEAPQRNDVSAHADKAQPKLSDRLRVLRKRVHGLVFRYHKSGGGEPQEINIILNSMFGDDAATATEATLHKRIMWLESRI